VRPIGQRPWPPQSAPPPPPRHARHGLPGATSLYSTHPALCALAIAALHRLCKMSPPEPQARRQPSSIRRRGVPPEEAAATSSFARQLNVRRPRPSPGKHLSAAITMRTGCPENNCRRRQPQISAASPRLSRR
jgi:hypothetical protein